MQPNAQRNGIINFLVLLLAGICLFDVAQYSHSFAGQLGAIIHGLRTLVSVVSFFQMRREERGRLEKMEFEELARSAATSALFNVQETEVFPARRSREQFERFFI